MKRKICLLLAALILLAGLVVACKPGNDPVETSDGTKKADERMNPDIEVRKFGGYTYTVYGLGPNEGGDWNVHDLLTPDEEERTDAISDAIYKRNLFLEETYGFDFDLIESDTRWPYTIVAGLLLAGDDTIDDYCVNPADAVSLAASGLLYNMKSLPYLDLEADYWDPSIVSPMSVYGKLYCATGAISIVPKEGVRAMYFNKTIAEDKKIPSIYQMVYDKTWTIDKLFQYASVGSSDVNGNGKRDAEDVYGIMAQGSLGMLLFQGAGERSIIKNNDDEFIIGCDTDRSINVAQKIAGYINTKKDDIWQSFWQEMLVRFNEEKALFYTEVMLHVKTMRGYEVDFGIIPTPMYDEMQENYSHWVNFGEMYVHTIPAHAEDPNRTAYILETTAVASKYYLIPAYYEVSLKSKWSRDTESEDMLDIIFSTYSLDLGNVYNFGQLFNYVDRAVSTNGGLTTVLGALRNITESQINDTIDKFLALD